MCGIAGFFNTSALSAEHLKQMLAALAHRGPDNEDVYIDELVSIGHRRLSILDLNKRSNQPMKSENHRFVLSYNGEIYNYLEIKNELSNEFPDQKFHTSGDTEVVLVAFERWGVKAFSKFNGMFAVSIYDKQEEKIYLARDRFGVKPLFFYFDGTNFAFSSELKGLLPLPFVKKEINPEALSHYFHAGFIPTPISIYKRIYKVKPGSYISVDVNMLISEKFCELSLVSQDDNASSLNYIDRCEELLHNSIKRQLQSDVPLGVFLSGGVDSSLIASLSARILKERVSTFSIGFKEKEYDESIFAKKIAEYIKSDHHELIVSIEDALNYIDMLPSRYSEPFADSSAIPTLMVSNLASKHVKVVFSGDGGDEVFMGYGTYRWAKRLDNLFYFNFFNRYRNAFLMLGNRYKRGYYIYSDHSNRNSHVFSQEQYLFSEEELPMLLNKNAGIGALFSGKLTWGSGQFNHPSEKQNLFDFYHYLPDDLLTKVDRASMAYSIEARVPFLDNELFNYVVGLSAEAKYFNNGPKYISKTILGRYLPEHLFKRPKKGFSIPLPKWINKELESDVNFHLSTANLERHGYFNVKYVHNLLKRYRGGDAFLYNRIWSIYMFQKWFNLNH
ncbi:MAG: asparagine synthase (glutamine-hydrolyzing) [Flavobacteriales bacterium]